MDFELLELKLKGYCCSQMIMAMGLKRLEKENPDLIAAMAGLCNGIWSGKLCGTLSAAICLLCLADPEEASRSYIQDITDWFENQFGSTECDEIVGDNPLKKIEQCPVMVERTFEQIEELLGW